LADLCICAARLAACEADIEARGLMVKGYRGAMVKNPSVAFGMQYRAALLKLTAQFGMTMASRGRLTLAAPAEREKTLAEMLFDGAQGEHE
jgi:P27 family predicted phage terminase small subunit